MVKYLLGLSLLSFASCAPFSVISGVSAASLISGYADSADHLAEAEKRDIIREAKNQFVKMLQHLSPKEREQVLKKIMEEWYDDDYEDVRLGRVRTIGENLHAKQRKILGVVHHNLDMGN
jgi:hypothetical protein